MLIGNPEFRENPEYAYGVARIRALETKLIDPGEFNSLISTSIERLVPYIAELTGIESTDSKKPYAVMDSLERRFTETLYLVKSLLLEEETKRLVSLRYDYELLKLILKEKREVQISLPENFQDRSSYSYEDLKKMLEEGRTLDLGAVMNDTYLRISEEREIKGSEIDYRCDCAYYQEIFSIVNSLGNDFIEAFFLREVDALNIKCAARLKLLGGKRTELRERYLHFGTIGREYLEQILDLTIEGFAQKIVFSPLSPVMLRVNRGASEEEQVAELERLIDEDMLLFLRESIFVTFGIEPVLSYLWINEIELRNLRTVLIAKYAGIPESQIKSHLRGVYG